MADGVFMHMVTGKEYVNIFPIWDWHKIPGITAELHGNTFPLINWGNRAAGGSDFAGGVSDNNCGLIAMIHDRADVYAKKAWFMTPECIVAVAAGIRSSNSSAIFTTLEQNYFSEKVVLQDGSEFTDGDTTLQGQTRLFHNSTLYENPENGSAMKLSVKTQSGSYSLINNGGSTDNISEKVFTLGIDHGIQPQNKTYAYGVIPNASADYQNSGKVFPAEVLLNSDTIQVMRLNSGSYVGGVFYKAGMFEHDTLQDFGTDWPCVVLLHHQSMDSIMVYLSDPERKNSNITIHIEGGYTGPPLTIYDSLANITSLTMFMPTDMYAGSTVSALLVSRNTAIHTGNGTYSTIPIAVRGMNKTGIWLSLNMPVSYQLTLFDVKGKKVYSIRKQGNNGLQYISFRNRPLSNGLYYICLQTDQSVSVKKRLLAE
jgi:chondroitin AC lyase